MKGLRYLTAGLSLTLSTLVCGAQQVVTLDELSLLPNTYYNGSDLAGGFTSGDVLFRNSFNPTWGNWAGFAYSNVDDPVTPGFFNQYAAISGTDASGGGNYAIGFDDTFGPEMDVIEFATPSQVRGLYANNTTYTGLSMMLGDAFAKQFGGPTGDDPDFFLLTITGRDEDGHDTGVVEFYLADYRFEDNVLDYVVTDWTWVDLTGLGAEVASLHFSLTSSDAGAFGMNTPAFFALDNVTYVPHDVWEARTDLAIHDVQVDTTRRGTVATVTVDNLGGRPAHGWVLTLTYHRDFRRPLIHWRGLRRVQPGERRAVPVRCLPGFRWLPDGEYTVRTLVLPRRFRDEVTLRNNSKMTTFSR